MEEQGVSLGNALGTTSEMVAPTPEIPKVKERIIPIAVSGVYQGHLIKQEFSFPVPVGVPNDQIILFVWEALSRTAGLTVAEGDGDYKFYPFSLFEEPLTARIGADSGVRL